ncbi:MAG: hypothetical protein WC314_13230 [Vulcanimicrobiota bacterium]
MKSSRGLSLLELIVSTAVLAVIGTFGILSLQQPRGTAQSRAMAEMLLEEIRAARQQAITTQSPVALAFPSANGTSQITQSFYQLEGLVEPRVARAVDYSGNFPEACLYVGGWGTADAPSGSFALNRDFAITNWIPDDFSDHLLIFTPGGTVVSPGLPTFEGKFRLLVARGVDASGGRLAAAGSPFSISVSRTGATSLTPGMEGDPGVDTTSRVEVRAVPLPKLKPNPKDKSPEIVEVLLEPEPLSASKVEARVPTQGYLLLKVLARDDSDRLSLKWTSKATSGGGKGHFSSETPTPMVWNSQKKLWEGTWMWTPERDSEPGQRFRLDCVVRDSAGNKDQSDLGAGLLVEIVDDQKVATVNKSKNNDFEVVSMSPAGGNIKRLTLPGYADQAQNLTPSWSPNGRRLAFFSGVKRDTPYDPKEKLTATLFVVNDDGLDLRPLFEVEGTFNELALGPSWSPDGTYVAFSAYSVSGSPSKPTVNARAYKAPVYDDNPELGQNFGINAPRALAITNSKNAEGEVRNHHYVDSDVRFHPRHNWILFVREKPDGAGGRESALYVKRAGDGAELPGTNLFMVARINNDRLGAEAYWSPDGKKIVYVTENGYNLRVVEVTVNRHTFSVKDDYIVFRGLKGPLDLEAGENPAFSTDDLELNVNPSTPRFSRDGKKIAFVDQIRGKLFVLFFKEVDGKLVLVKRNKANNTEDLHYFCWNPNGDELLYNTHTDGKLFRVAVSETEDFKPTRLSPNSMHAWTTPAWWFHYASNIVGDEES